MPNMAHCRFQNTLKDLKECFESLKEHEELDEEEGGARDCLIQLCHAISDHYAD